MVLDSDRVWKIVILIICLVLSALFSASETALMSLSKIRVKQMIENREKGANRINKLLSDPSRLLSAILIGNNVVNIGASSLMTSLAIDAFGNTGVGVATGIMTLLILVFGEITPKSLAAKNSEKISVRLSGFIEFVTNLLTPISFVLNIITDFLVKLLGGEVDKKKPFITQEELKTIVNVSYKEGVLEGEEKDMIYNVFDFSDSQVNDVMVPRTEIVAIDVDLPYEEIIKIINKEQYSRIPVYENTIDNIIGILYVKDLLFLDVNKESPFDLRKYIRQPYFTPEYKSIKELFKEMRTNRNHMVVIIDEYGGTEGIVTIEDVVEEIVGDIEDEYDKKIKEIEVIKEDEYLVNGNVRIDTINELIGTHIESKDFDTIAGFVIGIIDRLPEAGEEIEYENIRFIIENIDRNRIKKIRILT
ncbi:MAG: HlyC/CorC family transporter [Tissierellia bacterium]|jgi:putative hemolysin|nr:HlyC/CorC family transporter [Tissierellia bacterium]HOG62194.1 hemolysin family protein [Sedimentibacter sp.]HPV84920.1 hemolysin family protein [Sedimentibacter sp.]HPY55519.1 hemolysin family protein [Sedimentibacter sp.]HQC69286.1 hemolysin family protein [Sedimentibacter sp.]